MQNQLIISIISADKPGIIELLSKTIRANHGNWLGSNFCRLSGQFAGIVEIGVVHEHQQNLIAAIKNLTQHNIQLHIAEGTKDKEQQCKLATLTVVGNDKAGIINQISTRLAEHQVNLLNLKSSCESAPNWGSLLFKAEATLELPTNIDIDDIQEALEDIANDLVVEINLE
ncbi:ACT domain protein [Catenovulum agarivorans DS-2]|uniref:Glycine cleavage system transcriptional repressor n=1 Tax=Catenovulum agarivorans DS-2 TaxID=1328313 RepID=W7QC04_9ALTE|nr:ACT domain-containing protein [Catenovulum agarivorans]EWH09546.1 ACT domain protein [Catenovulum agarivorans DS-2]